MKPSEAGHRRRTNDPEGVRRRLVEAAYQAFTTRGYNATSVHDLKRETGATGGALSHHFPTKKELGLAVLRDEVARAVDEAWIEPMRRAATAAEGIAAVFNAIAQELDRKQAVQGCPLNNLALELAGQDGDFRAEVDATFARWTRAVAEKLRADIDAGLLSGIDPEAFAVFVVASYSGAMAMAKAGQTSAPLKACAAQLLEALKGR